MELQPAAAAAGDWVRHDPAAAAALLDQAGLLQGADGIRRPPGGEPLRYDMLCVSGWSDWVRGAQVIARGRRDVGIEAAVRTYDFSAWFQRVQERGLNLTWAGHSRGRPPTPSTSG